MGYDDHGHVAVRKRFYNLQNLAGKFRVEGGGGFIKAKDIGLERKGSCYCNTLLLTAGKLVRIIIQLVGKTDFCKELFCFRFNFCLNLFFVVLIFRFFFFQKLFCKHYITEDGILRKKVEVLENKAKMKAFFSDIAFACADFLRSVEKSLPVYDNFAFVRGFKKIYAAKKGGFSVAGRTDNRHNVAFFKGKIYSL